MVRVAPGEAVNGLDGPQPVHRAVRVVHAPGRGEAGGVADVVRFGLQRVGVEREHDLGLVEVVQRIMPLRLKDGVKKSVLPSLEELRAFAESCTRIAWIPEGNATEILSNTTAMAPSAMA